MYRIIPRLFIFLHCIAGLICPLPARAGTDIAGAYRSFLHSVHRVRVGADAQQAKSVLFYAVCDSMPTYWTGTPWDFNGTTRTPRAGSIACGYFVTNVLSDLGFRIDRVKLAQQASSVMIRKLTTHIHSFRSVRDLHQFVRSQPDRQIYLIGLDCHTGFLIRDGGHVWFFHANYIGRQGVLKEEASSSAALRAAHTFLLGNLSAHPHLLEFWPGR